MEKIPVSGRNGFIPSHHYAVPWDCLEKERLLEECPGGTSAFGPIMAFWFLVMALLGFGGSYIIPQFYSPPRAGLGYLREGGQSGFLMLGGVFLFVMGAEALYADMGHFGAKPIRLSLVGARLSEHRAQRCRPGGTRSLGCSHNG
jgi:hypothetical protein